MKSRIVLFTLLLALCLFSCDNFSFYDKYSEYVPDPIDVAIENIDYSEENAFITLWNFDSINPPFVFPLDPDGDYVFSIHWGDGSSQIVTEIGESLEHYYETEGYVLDGQYTITVYGQIDGFGHSEDRFDSMDLLVDVLQWGSVKLHDKGSAFSNLQCQGFSAADILDTSENTNFSSMFSSAFAFNGDLSSWDTSSVTDMSSMFLGASAFNGDLSSWDTSSVTNMSNMFLEASAFNGDLSSWDTSSVTDMSNMFNGTSDFNGDLSSWDTSSVTNMSNMFLEASAFNGDLSTWDTSGVFDMSSMFSYASAFNGDLSTWDTSKVMDMSSMFNDAFAFNGDLSTWDTSRVLNMSNMFFGASAFNGNLSSWDTSRVINVDSMFDGSGIFDSEPLWYILYSAINNVSFDFLNFQNRLDLNDTIDNSLLSLRVNGLSSYDGSLYAATVSGLSVSSDGGANWANYPINTNPASFYSKALLDIYVNSNGIFALKDNDGGLIRSTDNGQSWEQCSPLHSGEFGQIIAFDNYLFVTGDYNNYYLYYSDDYGLSWNQIEGPGVSIISDIVRLADGTFWISTYGSGIYWASDLDGIWTLQESISSYSSSFYQLELFQGNLYALDYSNVLYCSTDEGVTWSSIYSDLEYQILAATDSSLYFVANGSLYAFDGTDRTIYSPYSGNYMDLAEHNGTFYIATANSGILNSSGWSFIVPDSVVAEPIEKLAFSNDTLALASGNSGFFLGDLNNTWTRNQWTMDSWTYTSGTLNEFSNISIYGNEILTSTSGTLLFSTDHGVNWNNTTPGIFHINDIECNENGWYCLDENNLYFSSDQGSSWTSLYNNNIGFLRHMAVSGSFIVILGSSNIYYSTDSGISWNSKTADELGLLGAYELNRVRCEDGVVVLCSEYNAFITTDFSTFLDMNSIIGETEGSILINDVDMADGRIYLGTQSGLYISSDSGNSWQNSFIPEGMLSSNIHRVVADGTSLILSGLYYISVYDIVE